jgi:uncharacterized protein (DUF697 family)
MARYFDPGVILTFAEGLLARARWIAIVWTLFGVAAGGIAVATVVGNPLLAAACLLVGGVVGASVGQSRAFALRLAAQQALWQVAVEEHLSKIVEQTGASANVRVA